MTTFFTNRHYPPNVVKKGLDRARSVPRQSTLHTTNRPDNDRPVVVIPYHPHHLPIKRIILDNWSTLQDDPLIGETFSSTPLIAYKRLTNLREDLVHSKLPKLTPHNPHPTPGTQQCTKTGCKACPFLDQETHLQGSGNRHFTIKRTFNCQMHNLIYAIRCTLCGQLYIGETERTLETRFSEPLRHTRQNHINSPVGIHFNQPNHTTHHMRVSIIWKVKGDVVDRKNLETWLIAKLGTISPLGMNRKN